MHGKTRRRWPVWLLIALALSCTAVDQARSELLEACLADDGRAQQQVIAPFSDVSATLRCRVPERD